MSCKQFIRQVDTAVNDKNVWTEIRSEKNDMGKTSRREVSSPESETGRKGSKSGAPAEIGRYHMYLESFVLQEIKREVTKVIPLLSKWQKIMELCPFILTPNQAPTLLKKISSTQLNMKFFLLINVKMPTVVGSLTFMSKKNSIQGLVILKNAEFLDIFVLMNI